MDEEKKRGRREEWRETGKGKKTRRGKGTIF